MSLKIQYHSNGDIPENQKHYIDGKAKVVHTIEYENDFWPGQLKHIGWLEAHNDGVDAKLPSDMDWSKHGTEDKQQGN